MRVNQKTPHFLLENLKFFRDDLYKNHKSKTSLQFLQTSVLHYAICLEIGIGTYSKEYISYEKICYCVPKKFGSRSTIQTILNDGVEKKFFNKKISKKDKRIKTYSLSDEFKNSIEDWLKSQLVRMQFYKDVA